METIEIIKKLSIPLKYNEKSFIKEITKTPKCLIARNAKMKLTGKGFYQTSLPALKGLWNHNGALEEFTTCPNAGVCAGFCYASQGAYRFSGTNIDHTRKLNMLLNHSNVWRDIMIGEIIGHRATNLRWHDAGDFFSESYMKLAIEVMEATPDVNHYCYTKMISLFERFKTLFPKNFTYVYSYGGKEDKLIDIKKHRHSRIFPIEADIEANGYTPAVHTDFPASDKTVKNIGLLAHSQRKVSDKVFEPNSSIKVV